MKNFVDSTRSEILWTLYQSTKSDNTQLAKCHQNERLKSAKLANDMVVLKKQLMDSVTECSILKAQISKWEQLKKATQVFLFCNWILFRLSSTKTKVNIKVDHPPKTFFSCCNKTIRDGAIAYINPQKDAFSLLFSLAFQIFVQLIQIGA